MMRLFPRDLLTDGAHYLAEEASWQSDTKERIGFANSSTT